MHQLRVELSVLVSGFMPPIKEKKRSGKLVKVIGIPDPKKCKNRGGDW